MSGRRQALLAAAIALLGLAAPLLFPEFRAQIALLWVMVLFALTWDILGGQTGYNSFGNIVFFGVGMYASAVLQRDGGLSYFSGLALGMAAGALIATLLAAALGAMLLSMRGHYFAIATLGLGIAAAEIAGGWEYLGAGSGMTTPLFPGEAGGQYLFFSYLFLALAALLFVLLAWLYRTRFGLALNAIRDDEDKAEALGIRTGWTKTVAWMIAAFFLGLCGGAVGNLLRFVDPRDTAFAGSTYGVWMVLMAILGGKGTLWGPVLGAVVFHVTQELLWTHVLGWQRVALGLIIVAIVVFFPQGILGWARQRWPERFGHRIEAAP
jgi:branched-chain amino acid transport system permease protein